MNTTTRTKPMRRFESWIVAWACFFSSSIKILTFSYVDPSFDIDLMSYYIVKNIKIRKAERERLKNAY